jgi:hypothetical protein
MSARLTRHAGGTIRACIGMQRLSVPHGRRHPLTHAVVASGGSATRRGPFQALIFRLIDRCFVAAEAGVALSPLVPPCGEVCSLKVPQAPSCERS